MKQRKRRKRSFVVLLILLLLLLIVGGFFAYRQYGKRGITPKPEATPMPLDDSAAEWEGEQQLPHVVGEQDFIAIPGCNTLVFSAGETKQKVNFYNPSQNTCLFSVSSHLKKPIKHKQNSGKCGIIGAKGKGETRKKACTWRALCIGGS